MNSKELAMSVDLNPARKRPVNLMLNESLVLRGKTYTSNLSTTMELTGAARPYRAASRERNERG
jgi:hypothetical protein